MSINGDLSRDERLDMLRSCLTPERFDELNRREMLARHHAGASPQAARVARARSPHASLREAHIRTGKANSPTDLSQAWEAFSRFAALPIANVSGDQDQDTVRVEAEPRGQGGLLLILERRSTFDGASETQIGGAEIHVDPNPVISQPAAASASAPADDPGLTTEILDSHATFKAIFTIHLNASVTVFEDA